MSVSDSSRAIGSVTRLLKDRLERCGYPSVHIGHPQDAVTSSPGAKLNLFLYEVGFDPHVKNTRVIEPTASRLWLNLKFLLTAIDAQGASESSEALELLGGAIIALHTNPVLQWEEGTPSELQSPLTSSPAPLHISFDQNSAELTSRLLQGHSGRYRTSVAFQIRPVALAAASTASSLSRSPT